MNDARRTRAAVLRLAIATLVLVAALFVFVFPTSALLDQRRALRSAEHRLAVLRDQNRKLADESRRLLSPAEIERAARERFEMVQPGEQAWALVPQPPPAATTPSTAPSSTPTPASGATGRRTHP